MANFYFGLFKIVFTLSILQRGFCQVDDYDNFIDENVEFVEPIKNSTATVGTNLELKCSVRHLGNSRIMWYRKENGKREEILAVNTLKISKSPNLSFSMIPRSGDVMESIIYIYNIGILDGGLYMCGVNTNPMITQSGAVTVVPKPIVIPNKVGKKAIVESSTSTYRPRPPSPPPVIIEYNPSPMEHPIIIQRKDSSTLFCFDLGKIWTNTKVKAKDFVTNAWEKFNSMFNF